MTIRECRRIAAMSMREAQAELEPLYGDAWADVYWDAVEACEDEYERGVGPAWEDA